LDIKGGAAIVTGSATGIGAATALALAERGCNVVINYTKSEVEAKATQARCEAAGVETVLCRADVSVDDDCRRMVRIAVEKWGRIHALVNNAATTKACPHDDLEGLSAADFYRIYAVNTIGPYQMCRAVAPSMREAGEGAIVNISAQAGITGHGSSIAYATSKAALNTMTLSMARVLAPEIRLNTVCPSLVTGRWMRGILGAAAYDETVARTTESNPLHRVNTPEDVARTALWLIEGADLMTGQLFVMDGGRHLL
jgi:3-oxoacyl-[acyl-carrier protein] reductase